MSQTTEELDRIEASLKASEDPYAKVVSLAIEAEPQRRADLLDHWQNADPVATSAFALYLINRRGLAISTGLASQLKPWVRQVFTDAKTLKTNTLEQLDRITDGCGKAGQGTKTYPRMTLEQRSAVADGLAA